jgi:hypothetical protein
MSETPNIQELVQEQLDSLPESVREAVDSQEWRRKVYDIGRKYSLKIDQLGALEQSTYYTMIGLVPSSQYISELVNQVGVGRDIASSLAKEIDDGVFEDIRSFIMQMDGVDEDTANLLDKTLGEPHVPSGAVPSREDLLSEIEAIGEPTSSPAPVVTFSPIETQLSKATASRPIDLNPAPAPVPTQPAAPILPEAPKPAPIVIPVISLTDAADDTGIEFTESPQGLDKEDAPTDTQLATASTEDAALDLDSVATDEHAAATPAAAQTIPTSDGKISPVPITNDPYQEQF